MKMQAWTVCGTRIARILGPHETTKGYVWADVVNPFMDDGKTSRIPVREEQIVWKPV